MAIDEHLHFCLSLQRPLVADLDQTFCWSPFSVANALSLAAHGARGKTRDELIRAVVGSARGDLDLHVKQLHEAAVFASSRSASPGPASPRDPAWTVAVSNTLWVDSDLVLHPGLGDNMGPHSGTPVRHTAFVTAPEQSRATINRDVGETTRGLIPTLLSPGDVSSDTIAMLVNALYLRASWKKPFAPSNTTSGTFTTPDGPVDIPLMRTTARMRYGRRHGWQIVDIPALGGVTVTILLPDSPLAAAEPHLNSHLLGELLDATVGGTVQLTLPRLALKFRTQLAPALQAFGVTSLFGPHCDLSGFCQDAISVSTVHHEAVLRVDEHGIEGAAATSVGIERCMVARDPVTVTVDRPFLLLVRRHAAVFFSARVTRP